MNSHNAIHLLFQVDGPNTLLGDVIINIQSGSDHTDANILHEGTEYEMIQQWLQTIEKPLIDRKRTIVICRKCNRVICRKWTIVICRKCTIVICRKCNIVICF